MPVTFRRQNMNLQGADQLIAAPLAGQDDFARIQPRLRSRDQDGPLPLSFAQERLWFLEQINPGDASGTLSRAIKITGQLKLDLMQRALQAISNRHESLRTTFATNQHYSDRDSKPQLIAANRTIEISLIDLSHDPVNQREAKARELAQAAAQRPFDLTLGPLLRATLFRLGETEHVLLLSLHRIVCDDSSLQILIDELWTGYKAFANQGVWSNSPLEIQYADYALWQRKLNENASISAALDFWRAKLRGAPTVIELAVDRARPPVRSWHGGSVSVELESEVVEQLDAIGVSVRESLATVLLTAFNVALARHSGQDDLVVGYSVSNRSAEAKHLIGPFASFLSLRTSLSSDPTFRELLSGIRNAKLEAQAHFVPFEKLLDELELEPSLSRPPVFQVAFNFQQTKPWIAPSGLTLEEFAFDDGITRFDLALDVFENSSYLDCRFRYNTDLFNRTTIQRFADHFKTLVFGVVNNPDQRVFALPMLTSPERKQILIDWNNTEGFADDAQSILQLFESQVDLTPKAIAAAFESKEITYAELNRRANQLAHHLRKRGVGPEVLVAICVKRSLDMIVGLLGILKAGGAYLPLDPAYPTSRLDFMLEDSEARLLLTQESIKLQLPATRAEIVCLDADWPAINNECDQNLATKPEAKNLAYVIYTSGSTGKPKGAMITHEGISNRLQWMQEAYGLSEQDSVLQKTPFTFDVSVWEFFWPLMTGARLVMAEPGAHGDSTYLVEVIKREQITTIHFVPSMLAAFLEDRGVGACGSLKRVFCSGEALPFELKERCRLQLKADLHNLYGPTEASVDVTYWDCGSSNERQIVPIGRPIANTQVYVLDGHLQPVPVGVPGELYIGGTGLARGYLKRADLTGDRFIPDPFGNKDGRIYRTGDLGRYLEDGNIEYLGRTDHQVKLRGFRIELGEIEAVLRSQSLVRDVAVVVRQEKLVAYVVPSVKPADGAAKLWSELRNFVKTKLPEYMCPAIFVELDALPLTPNGKVDRHALPVLNASRPDLEEAYVAPRDRLEEQLLTLWTNVLQLKSIGVRDNFFELGGNSLLAARLFAQIENRLGKHLPLATLFQFPTIEQLADCLRDSETSQRWSSLVGIQPEGSRPPLFCVHAAGANVLIYRPLARHLGNNQPVYALQAPGLDGRTSPLTTVEEMATLYVKEIRAVQSEGPYFLLGASFGGLVVYEMAQQLLAQNQEVALLAMLNTNCPVYTMAKRVRCHLGHLRESGPGHYASEVRNSVKRRLIREGAKEHNGSRKLNNTDGQIQELLVDDSGVDAALVRTITTILSAEQRYVPRQREYPGKITLFFARDAKTDFEDNRLGWRRLADGGLDLYVVPGTHTSMREEPYVAELVEKLKGCLEKALSKNLDTNQQ